MGMAMRGLTHCNNCGTSLDMNEFGLCTRCREEEEEKEKERLKKEEENKLKNKIKAEVKKEVKDEMKDDIMKEFAEAKYNSPIPEMCIESSKPDGFTYNDWYADIGYRIISEFLKGNNQIIINFKHKEEDSL